MVVNVRRITSVVDSSSHWVVDGSMAEHVPLQVDHTRREEHSDRREVEGVQLDGSMAGVVGSSQIGCQRSKQDRLDSSRAVYLPWHPVPCTCPVWETLVFVSSPSPPSTLCRSDRCCAGL